jgi:hypothetical protein
MASSIGIRQCIQIPIILRVSKWYLTLNCINVGRKQEEKPKSMQHETELRQSKRDPGRRLQLTPCSLVAFTSRRRRRKVRTTRCPRRPRPIHFTLGHCYLTILFSLYAYWLCRYSYVVLVEETRRVHLFACEFSTLSLTTMRPTASVTASLRAIASQRLRSVPQSAILHCPRFNPNSFSVGRQRIHCEFTLAAKAA